MGRTSTSVILVSAPPAPSAPPPHKWGGQVLRSYWCRPLRRLRRHLPINGEDKYFSHSSSPLSLTLSPERGEGKLFSSLRDRCYGVAEVLHEAGGLRHQLPVALRHLVLLEVKVVFQADPDITAHRDRGC